jgi:hypothetical protein
MRSLEEMPPVLVRQLLGPYVLGLHFLLQGDFLQLGRGFPTERADLVFGDPPRSSEQVLHPEKYWDEEKRDPPVRVEISEATETLGEAWERRGEGVLGELTLGLLVGAPTPAPAAVASGAFDPEGWTNEAASGWCGDRWELWRDDARNELLLLLTRWDTVEDAREFVAALREDRSLVVKRRGAAVALLAGEAGRRGRRLMSRALSGIPRSGCSVPAEPVE